jgi:hypothetical protein
LHNVQAGHVSCGAKPPQVALALGKRQTAQINIAFEQKIEGKERHPRHVGPALSHLGVEGTEIGSTAVVANAQFAVQNRRVRWELREGLG